MLTRFGSVLLWLAFAAAAVVEPSALHDAWVWVNDLHIVPRVILWILLLPWMLGLLVVEQDWSTGARAVVVVLLALVHLAVTDPARRPARRPGRRRERERSRR